MDLTELLEIRREEAGNGKKLSYDNFGDRVGIPGPTLWRLMKRKTTPQLDTLWPLFTWAETNRDSDLIEALLRFFGVTAEIEIKYK